MFSHVGDANSQDWSRIAQEHAAYQQTEAPVRIMESLQRLDSIVGGFPVSQLTHCLITATNARRSGASDEEVVAALCHDLGKLLSIPNHGPIAAEMLKPYVSDNIYHAVYWHQEFQGRYYYEEFGKDPQARQRFAGESWYAFAEKLVDAWDAPAFGTDADFDPLETFEPEIRRVFSTPRNSG